MFEVSFDPHDNRLWITPQASLATLNSGELKAAVTALKNETILRYGGKAFIDLTAFQTPELLAELKDQGFTLDLSSRSGMNRIRVISPAELLASSRKLKPADAASLTLIRDDTLISTHTTEILTLMRKSGFDPAKVKDYQEKGALGLKAMLHNAALFGFKNKESKLVAFCRISNLNNAMKHAYLGDTLIDRDFFSSCKAGTLLAVASSIIASTIGFALMAKTPAAWAGALAVTLATIIGAATLALAMPVRGVAAVYEVAADEASTRGLEQLTLIVPAGIGQMIGSLLGCHMPPTDSLAAHFAPATPELANLVREVATKAASASAGAGGEMNTTAVWNSAAKGSDTDSDPAPLI